MRVIAQRMGFYGGIRRREGTIFVVPDGLKSKTDWFVPLTEDNVPAPKARGRQKQQALSEIAREVPKRSYDRKDKDEGDALDRDVI